MTSKIDVLFEHERAIVMHAEWQDVCIALARGGPKLDVTICDPPYTEHVHKNIRSCSTNGKLKVKAWEVGFDPLADFAHVPTLLEVTSRWVLCFTALESFGDYVDAAGGHWKQGGRYVRSEIWRKQQAAPQLSGDRPANSCEGIAVMHARAPDMGRMHWNGRGERAEKRHPAQKPEALMRRLCELFSDEGEWIGDFFCGSGATGVAALRLGRRVILCDKDRQWAEYTAARVREICFSTQ